MTSLEPLLTEFEPVELPVGKGIVAPLMGDRKVQHELQREQPWHRFAATLFAKGCTQKEVAQTCEVHINSVQNLMAQPWFQHRVLEIMAESMGTSDIMTMFEAEALNSLNTIVEIRDNGKIAPQTRLAAAIQLLDRSQGKPVQRMEHSNVTVSADPVAEAERLTADNDRLRNKL